MAPRKPARRAAPAAYLIVGEDSYLRTHLREEIIAAAVPAEARAFAVAEFALDRTSLDEVLARANVRPMLNPRQVLVLSELEAVEEEHWDELEAYFESPPDFTVLVFEAEKLDRRTRGARLLLESCQVLAADSPGDTAAVEAAIGFAREQGIELDRDTAEELVFVLGTDQGRLRAELTKLRAYAGAGGQVDRPAVAALVSPARQFSVFELADLLAERRRAEALVRLRHLLDAGESPIGIVGLLAWLYRQLLIAQTLPQGAPAWKAADVLRAPRSRIPELLRQARRFSPEELREAFAALLEADVALKSTPPNPAAVLETLVVRLTPQGKPSLAGKS